MLNEKFFTQVKEFVFELFKNSLPSKMIYHNFDHTQMVVNAVEEIAHGEKIQKDDLNLLKLAAWFHDTGYTVSVENHEDESAKIAKDYLSKAGLDSDKIDTVISLIGVTKMPQNPKTHLERVMCDADLYHIGTPVYKEKGSLLRSEWELVCAKEFTDIEWLKEGDSFFENHQFFTDYAFTTLNSQKTANWLRLKKDLKKATSKIKEQEEKVAIKKQELKRKKEKDSRPDRGIETMYRVTLRNHIKLSDIADTKANILLSVSAIILSIALSTLFPKLDKPDNAYLIVPTLMFLGITVVTMIFSILSTRPKVTSGKFTKEDVKNKKVNLLFFGNFHKMPLNEFQEGMSEVMKDRDYLYKSLMKDLYFLGVVLEKKYKLLRIAYTIFMIGIIVCVISFVIAFQVMSVPNIGT